MIEKDYYGEVFYIEEKTPLKPEFFSPNLL